MTALLACRLMTFTKPISPGAAQELGALYAANGGPTDLAGEPHSPERIMFVHGAMTGHAACACAVVDEHGHNVNPGRAPLDARAAGRAEGSRKASETFARRRARKAADELAVIDPSLWDDETRRIVLTLATLAPASRVDDVLAAELPITLDELDRLVANLDANGGTWDDMPDGTEDTGEAFAAELHRMAAGDGTVPRPEPRPYPRPRPRPDPDPRPQPEPHPSMVLEKTGPTPRCTCTNLCGPCPVHDNGNYRA